MPTTKSPRARSRPVPSTAPSWPAAFAQIVRTLHHYVGVTLVLMTLVLAGAFASVLVRANSVTIGPVRVTHAR
ncbi:MAG: hypothetical protein JWM10_3144 [Myxococcaceae bacterium]|nr:hypothetical protein [Myxococcaceae bacterium]